jgi:hypothetical protein
MLTGMWFGRAEIRYITSLSSYESRWYCSERLRFKSARKSALVVLRAETFFTWRRKSLCRWSGSNETEL